MSSTKYDLEEHTATFGEAIIEFCANLPHSAVLSPLVSQRVRAGTSIGANYCEADDGESKKDFRHKVSLCRKEARETKYWLRMIAKAAPDLNVRARSLWREASELHLIFAANVRTTDRNLEAAQKAKRDGSVPLGIRH